MKAPYTQLHRTGLVCLLITLIASYKAKATDLNAGELLFTGYHANASTTDAFSFVVLVNLSGTTTVSFTDNGWLSTNVFRVGEQTVTWTYTGTLVAGREIRISGPSAGAATSELFNGVNNYTTIGTCSGSMPSFATSGDQVIAYRGTASAPTLIAGLHMNVYSTDLAQCANTTNANWDPVCITDNANFSVMPLGLAAGVSTTWIGTAGVSASEQDNAVFNCTGPLLTVSQVRAAVTNSANWTANSVAPPNFILPSSCDYFGLSLPLDLLAFEGTSNDKAISLTWKTINEYNHSHFELEKSADAIHFKPLSRIDGQGGFSYLPFDYEFRDEAPLKGVNYYRLKMVGSDHSSQYSKIIMVKFDDKGESIVISPNPAVSEITITASSEAYTMVTIFDQTNTIVLQQKLLTNKHKIDISQLPAGQYLITLSGDDEVSTERLIIVR